MEKRIVNRYCLALTDDESLPALSANKQVSITHFRYLDQQLFVIEASTEETLTSLCKEDAQQSHASSATDAPFKTERIFMKSPLGQDMASHHRAHAFSGTKRIAMTLLLQPDPKLLAEYKQIHRPENMWEQVLKNMDTMGIQDMELYLQGYRAFLIMDVPPNFDLGKEGERWGKLPREQEWQNYVARFQKTAPNGKIEEKWQIMNQLNIS